MRKQCAPQLLWHSICMTACATALAPTAFGQATRMKDPVVVAGSSLPSFLGVQPSRIVLFRWTGSALQQIPAQVDEVVVRPINAPYNADGCAGTGALPWNISFYADPNTFTGADTDPGFDADDEFVFMVRDAGTRAPSSTTTPPGCVAGSRIELALTDPLNGSNLGYVYVFRSDGSLAQGAGMSYVNYNFTFGSGLTAANYKASYNFCNGGVAENTTVTTANYSMRYTGRWIEDELKITAGGATGVDLLDRHQAFVYPTNCFRSEDTFTGARGPIVTTKSGPVRAIRSIMGANSGVFTQMTMKYTQSRVDHRVDFRVHPIGGYYDVLDFNSNAVGMTYYNDQNPAGVAVNGVPDTIVKTAPNRWELHTGPQGSIAGSYAFQTNILLGTEGFVEAYYDDSVTALCRCTGDLKAYGSSGFHLTTGVCTDHWATASGCGAAAKDFAGFRYTYLLPPGATPAEAAAYASQAINPVMVSIPSACPSDLDSSGYVDAGDVSLLLLDFGSCVGCPNDLDGNGSIDAGDVSILLLDFGPCSSAYGALPAPPERGSKGVGSTTLKSDTLKKR